MAKKQEDQVAENKALVIVQEKYLQALSDADVIKSAMAENLGEGETFSTNDLDTIQNPAGGATFWMIENSEGEEQPIKSLTGIILHIMPSRSRWDGSEEMGKPPLCSSSDGLIGIGDPGGYCETCEYNQFGEGGKAKVCKENKVLVMLFEGEFLPKVVKVTPASLKNFRTYVRKKLTTKGIKKYEVETIITLTKETGSKGDYAEMHFDRGQKVDKPEVIKAYIDGIIPYLDKNHQASGVPAVEDSPEEPDLVAA